MSRKPHIAIVDDDRDRSFGRDPAHPPEQEAVEHHVADDENRRPGEAVDEAARPAGHEGG